VEIFVHIFMVLKAFCDQMPHCCSFCFHIVRLEERYYPIFNRFRVLICSCFHGFYVLSYALLISCFESDLDLPCIITILIEYGFWENMTFSE
jgi:hypothetical protein